MQEPVYMLHLITCHGHIMPRLAELLFFFLCVCLVGPRFDKLIAKQCRS